MMQRASRIVNNALPVAGVFLHWVGAILVLLCGGVISAYATAPSITSLSVASGAVNSSVTITGTNFGTSQVSGSYVTINGAEATTYTLWSSTKITAQVPTGASTTGNIVVTVSGAGSSNGKAFTVIPSITSLSLTSGPQKMGFDVSGYTFGSPQGTSTVKIGTTPLTVTSWSNTKIAVQVPTTAATGSVTVTVGGNTNTGTTTFTVTTYGCP